MRQDFEKLRENSQHVVPLLDATPQQQRMTVSIELSEQPPSRDSAAVDATWTTLLKQHPRWFNGSIAWAQRYVIDSQIHVQCSQDEFKHLMYLVEHKISPLKEFGIAAAGVRCLLITSDNTVLLARRGEDVSWTGQILAIPGGLINADVKTAQEQALIELEEEIGITGAEVTQITLLGLSIEGEFPVLQVKMMIHTSLTSTQATERLNGAKDRYESGEFWFVPLMDVKQFIIDHKQDVRPETLDILRHITA